MAKKTIEEELQEALGNLAQANEQLGIANAKLEAANSAFEALTAKSADVEKSNEELAAKLQEALAINDDLQSEIEKLTATPANAPAKEKAPIKAGDFSFELDGAKYGFKWPVVTLNKQRVTAEDICSNVELQKQLVAANSSMLIAL
ncbi:hypothetical protein [Limnovirga soli]|uniref:Uncharacterized protein n=1 Tax=Limnovirga soli TaxID=2656915 RepID=A0A8J8FHP9_9BACT|nr:hypothetical protein [Limnovirga soli]NNV57383.1 hypothetical protein [Limnovirga soli]